MNPPSSGQRTERADDRAQPLAREALAARRLRDSAIALPLAATLLFASPLLDVVGEAGTLAGIPVSLLYIFGTWFLLIWITGRLARRLIRDVGKG